HPSHLPSRARVRRDFRVRTPAVGPRSRRRLSRGPRHHNAAQAGLRRYRGAPMNRPVHLLEALADRIRPFDVRAATAAQQALDHKTKPRRSLGRLEDLACSIAGMRGLPNPEFPRKAIVVMAADHGVAEEGVSAYPQEVTAQMLLNFARGGAAINVL